MGEEEAEGERRGGLADGEGEVAPLWVCARVRFAGGGEYAEESSLSEPLERSE